MIILEFTTYFLIVLTHYSRSDTANGQLLRWKQRNQIPAKATDQKGVPIPSMTASLTVGRQGPILLQDTNFLEQMAHFDRERIPERVVHAKGAGAFGEFQVTHDITNYTKAKIFEKLGKKTPVLVRFSTVSAEAGSADTVNDPRGFAVKFYTDEGNWDLVGNNIPNFPIRDPILFPSFVHSRKRNPETHLFDPNMFFDFVSLRQESVLHTIFQFTGIPDGYRKMNGFGVHTFKFVNKDDVPVYVKFHWVNHQAKVEGGVDYLNWNNATKIAGSDPDYSIRDLYNAIAEGDLPLWSLYIQVMTREEAQQYRWNPFDITKLWRTIDYPLIPVGIMTLNKNPENFFEDIEQAAFHPGNLIPGIEPSPDKMLQGRMFSYSDALRYRLGVNFDQLRVNRPINVSVNTYMRDGSGSILSRGGAPNYFPNSFMGAEISPRGKQSLYKENGGDVDRFDDLNDEDYSLATWHYNEVMTPTERQHLAHNIVSLLSLAEKNIQSRTLEMYAKVSKGLETNLKHLLKKHKIPNKQSGNQDMQTN